MSRACYALLMARALLLLTVPGKLSGPYNGSFGR